MRDVIYPQHISSILTRYVIRLLSMLVYISNNSNEIYVIYPQPISSILTRYVIRLLSMLVYISNNSNERCDLSTTYLIHPNTLSHQIVKHVSVHFE